MQKFQVYMQIFFVNHGSATANDIVSLINMTRKKVSEKFGIILDLEIKTIGFSKEVIE